MSQLPKVAARIAERFILREDRRRKARQNYIRVRNHQAGGRVVVNYSPRDAAKLIDDLAMFEVERGHGYFTTQGRY